MKTVYGWGVNDAAYAVSPRNGGKRVECPFYAKWRGMIARVHCEKYLLRNPTYRNVVICEDWRTFSNFAAWLSTKEWRGHELDKDILSGVLYSPETCLLVSKQVNYAVIGVRQAINGELIGAHFSKKEQKHQVICSDPFGKKKHLGYFPSKTEAHAVWRQAKRGHLVNLADAQTDKNVALALLQLSEELTENAL